MERYHRGERLEQSKRLKQKRKSYWGMTNPNQKQLGRVSQYPAICSCPACGNSRKYYGNGNQGISYKEYSDREFLKVV